MRRSMRSNILSNKRTPEKTRIPNPKGGSTCRKR